MKSDCSKHTDCELDEAETIHCMHSCPNWGIDCQPFFTCICQNCGNQYMACCECVVSGRLTGCKGDGDCPALGNAESIERAEALRKIMDNQ